MTNDIPIPECMKKLEDVWGRIDRFSTKPRKITGPSVGKLKKYVWKNCQDALKLLGVHYGSYRAPSFDGAICFNGSTQSIATMPLFLHTYLTWNGEEVVKPLVNAGMYTNHTSYVFDKGDPLWIESEHSLRNQSRQGFTNIWSKHHMNLSDIPQYGVAAYAKYDAAHNMKSSVIIPAGCACGALGIESPNQKNIRFGIGVYESRYELSKMWGGSKDQVRNCLVEITDSLTRLYVIDICSKMLLLNRNAVVRMAAHNLGVAVGAT